MAPSIRRNSFVQDLVDRLQKAPEQSTADAASDELPSYDYSDTIDLSSLVTSSYVKSFRVGTGASIFTSTLLPALLKARHEAILVTCFWAPSKTLDALRETLEALAAHRRRILDEGAGVLPTLRIRICLSSRSLFQKLLHTTSRDGYTYPPSTWPKLLGLPDEHTLKSARIEMQAKSLFFLPISVMHPKFLLLDRRRAFMPSCNVSWEPWLEGCVEFEGDAVDALMSFYQRTWEPELDLSEPLPPDQDLELDPAVFDAAVSTPALLTVQSTASYVATFDRDLGDAAAAQDPTQTILLPSSHHRNPRFRFLPWQEHAPPPATPLNTAVLQLLQHARRTCYIQTPNLTCEAVLRSVLAALERGVNVRIVTGKNMMTVEQIVTAGTTTSLCIRALIKRYEAMGAAPTAPAPAPAAIDPPGSRRSLLPSWTPRPASSSLLANPGSLQQLSSLAPPVGRLQISYFCSLRRGKDTGRGDPNGSSGQVRQQPDLEEALDEAAEEPVCPHIKLMMVDDRYTLLGSGNMDRASFYTSQELGILFCGEGFAQPVRNIMDRVLDGRLEHVYGYGSAQ